jgi:hypothetical protein
MARQPSTTKTSDPKHLAIAAHPASGVASDPKAQRVDASDVLHGRGLSMDELDVVRVTVLPGGRMDRRNAAAFLGRKPQTLAHWAAAGEGPPYLSVKGRVFYALADLRRFRGDEPVAA